LVFPFFLLLFWPFLISRWRTQFRLFVLPGPKQYPHPRAVLPEMQMRCQEERLSFFFGGRKKKPEAAPSIAAATSGVAGTDGALGAPGQGTSISPPFSKGKRGETPG